LALDARRKKLAARRVQSVDRPALHQHAARGADVQTLGDQATRGWPALPIHLETGEFIAVDADTGKVVWQFQTGSGINAMPVTYTHQGRQYVTVLSGIGGLYWNIAREQLKDKVPQGGSVWTFALLPE
jgi:glucose dehydrogenase